MLATLYMAANRTTSLVFINDVIVDKGHKINPEVYMPILFIQIRPNA